VRSSAGLVSGGSAGCSGEQRSFYITDPECSSHLDKLLGT